MTKVHMTQEMMNTHIREYNKALDKEDYRECDRLLKKYQFMTGGYDREVSTTSH